MSSPSDPPSSDRTDLGKNGIRPMPFFMALGWTIGITLVLYLLWTLASNIVGLVACQAVAYLLGLFLILRVHAPNASIREFLAIRSTHVVFYPIGVALGAAAWAPANAIVAYIERTYPSTEDNTAIVELLRTGSTLTRLTAGLVIIAVGPVLEEILFRGALFKPLERKYAASRSLAVGLTAVLFAGVHQSFQGMIPLAMLGVVLGLLRQLSGSLLPSVLAHGTFNAVTFYLMLTLSPAEADMPLPRRLVAAGSCATLLLLAGAHLLSTRTEGAARAQELDRQ